MLAFLFLWLALIPVDAEDLANATRGAELIEKQGCLSCHNFSRQPRRTVLAKPLANLLKKHLTPARFTGALWSHAPTMWTAIQRTGQAFPVLSTQQANDILAWFAAAGYFEPPGDPRRGAKTFTTQQCAKCHSNTEAGTGPPLSKWTSPADPIDLFIAIWQHAPSMKTAMDQRSMNWPSLSIEELSDILAYAEPVTASRSKAVTLVLGDSAKGRQLYSLRGCMSCHKGRQTRENVPLPHSFTELAAILWNHAPMMTNLPPMLTRQEVADLVAYLWASRYFEEGGRVMQGKSIFEGKRCVSCHESLHSPKPYSAASMLAALWKHSPAVLSKAGAAAIPWTPFLDGEMADLIAYLNIARSAALVE